MKKFLGVLACLFLFACDEEQRQEQQDPAGGHLDRSEMYKD